jgi:PleD family two-component response regulator
MEAQIEILVAGTNEKIMQTILRLLNTNNLWKATGTSTPGEVLQKCRETNYQIFLIGAGFTDSEETELSAAVKQVHPAIHIIPHYGGGSGLLFAEIYLALGTRNQAQ